MKSQLLGLLLVLGVAGCQAVPEDLAAEEPSTVLAVNALQRGISYSQARALLIDGGWRTVDYPIATAAQRCGASQECGIYPETELCSNTGQTVCRFSYVTETGERLAVTATGTSPGVLKVNGWGNV